MNVELTGSPASGESELNAGFGVTFNGVKHEAKN